MNEPQTPDRQRSELRKAVQFVLITGITLTLYFGLFFIGLGASPVQLTIMILQVVGLLAIALYIRREIRPRIIGLYGLIALGFYLLMFGICVNTQ